MSLDPKTAVIVGVGQISHRAAGLDDALTPGELMAEGYQMMLGDLSESALEALTKQVLDRCKWFPTIAECKAIMGEESYSNPFYVARRSSELTANGYPALSSHMKAISYE